MLKKKRLRRWHCLCETALCSLRCNALYTGSIYTKIGRSYPNIIFAARGVASAPSLDCGIVYKLSMFHSWKLLFVRVNFYQCKGTVNKRRRMHYFSVEIFRPELWCILDQFGRTLKTFFGYFPAKDVLVSSFFPNCRQICKTDSKTATLRSNCFV